MVIGNKYQIEPDNFFYTSSLSSNPIEFNVNLENSNIYDNNDNMDRETNEIDTSNLNINTEMTNRTDSLEIATTSIQNYDDQKRTIALNKIRNTLKRTITNPLLKQGNEQELEAIMKDMYDNVEKYLTEIMDCNNISKEDIFDSSIIKNSNYINEKSKGFFIINSGNNIYRQILKFYHGLVGNDPPRYSLLLCNDETTLEELMSFIYLAVFCPYHSLFIISKPDRLNLDIVYEMENIIEKFHDDRINIESYILFIFNDIGKSEIGKELLKLCKSADEPSEDLRTLALKDQIITSQKVENKEYYKNIEVIASSRAGLGKTFYIKKKCEEEKIIYRI